MEQQEDLLTGIHNEIFLEPVSTGTRFGNYLLDIIGFYILSLVVGIALGATGMYPEEKLQQYLISYTVYLIYYTLMEGATQGRTLGKFITGTRAIKDDGTAITWKDALLRSLCRIVPFEPFSALGGYPWHDKWTGTKVIKNKNKLD